MVSGTVRQLDGAEPPATNTIRMKEASWKLALGRQRWVVLRKRYVYWIQTAFPVGSLLARNFALPAHHIGGPCSNPHP
jgi:hypothetical protein